MLTGAHNNQLIIDVDGFEDLSDLIPLDLNTAKSRNSSSLIRSQ